MQDNRVFDFTQRDGQIGVNGGTLDQIASFAVDGAGRLYSVGLDGQIHRLTPQDDPPSREGDTFLDELGDLVEGMVDAVESLFDDLF
ncbi:MAG TPA: hypothetical protein VFB93_17860 [Burkholderiales bacterium]|nr:hypothetical protein [Burkholderiales bacterium]